MRLQPLAFGAALLVIGVVGYILLKPKETPEARLASFEMLIAKRDWGGLFDVTFPGEFSQRGVSKQQFIALLNESTRHLRDDQISEIQVKDVQTQIATQKRYLLTFPKIKSPGLTIGAYRGSERWFVTVGALPLAFAFGDADHRTGSKRFAKALRAANLPSYRIFDTKISCTVESLDRVANGEIELKAAWKRSP